VTAPGPSPAATAVRRSTAHTAPLRLDPGGTAELVGKILRGVPRLPGAACRDHPELFNSDDADDQGAAVAICRVCPALPQCRAWVSALPRACRPIGVVGGTINERPTS
jgi:WhiB family redox-sensing transcriptional regulator